MQFEFWQVYTVDITTSIVKIGHIFLSLESSLVPLSSDSRSAFCRYSLATPHPPFLFFNLDFARQ